MYLSDSFNGLAGLSDRYAPAIFNHRQMYGIPVSTVQQDAEGSTNISAFADMSTTGHPN
jgi:hypothetical protein